MCDYKVYLRPVPDGNGHIHRACVKKGEPIISDESHGHVHQLEVKDGTVVQTKEDIATTGHLHPIVTISQPSNVAAPMDVPNVPVEVTNVPVEASTTGIQKNWWKWLVLALILFGAYRWWTQQKQEKVDVRKILNDLSEELSDA